jgi:hypothetical protein
MAEIDIQEKRGQPTWVWIAGIVAVLVVAGVLWALLANGDDRDNATMRQDTVPTTPAAPTSGLDGAPDVLLTFVTFSER